MMTVTVRYYAVLRDLTGRNVEDFEIPLNSSGQVLIERVVDRYPAVADYAPFLRLATTKEYISKSTLLADDGEISLIPPVSGG